MHPHEFEVMTRQVRDADGKLWVPAPDKHVVLQGPVSLGAFFWALGRSRSVRVVPA